MRLEAATREQTRLLTDDQVPLLERPPPVFRMRHVETSPPGELLNQDTFYWGTLEGLGKVYVQVVIDAFCSLTFAKVYTSKMPITAAHLLYHWALPFYEAVRVPVKPVLTDNGREVSAPPEHHPYPLLLTQHDIEHRTTKIRSSRTNRFINQMERALLDEHFRAKAGRSGTSPSRKSTLTLTSSSRSTT